MNSTQNKNEPRIISRVRCTHRRPYINFQNRHFYRLFPPVRTVEAQSTTQTERAWFTDQNLPSIKVILTICPLRMSPNCRKQTRAKNTDSFTLGENKIQQEIGGSTKRVNESRCDYQRYLSSVWVLTTFKRTYKNESPRKYRWEKPHRKRK